MASRLLSEVKKEIRRRNYSYKTEQAYVRWIIRFVRFHNMNHPARMQEKHVVAFLNWLANERQVAASTQNQALCALVFLYDAIIKKPLGSLRNLKRAKEPNRIPVVLSQDEAHRIIRNMGGAAKTNGSTPVRQRTAAVGVPAAAGAGC